MRTVTTTMNVFTFEELSEKAKDRARDWWRSTWDSYDFEPDIEDAATVADLFGLDIRAKRVNLKDGSWGYAPSVYWSGFSYQGDGASFKGYYRHKAGALAAVTSYAPKDEALHGIVRRLTQVQKRNFYQLRADIVQRGNYCHEMTMQFEVHRADDKPVSGEDEEELKECLRDFARWIYRNLEREYEYQNSDEYIDEAIIINEYEFTEEGKVV